MTEIVEPTPSGAVMAQLSMMGMAFSEPSYCVACALKCLEQEEITTTLETVMGEAKDNLKELADKNTDLEGLDQLKKYYSEVESYRQFAMNPTGSYVDAKSTAETYRTNIKNYKNELSIDFE